MDYFTLAYMKTYASVNCRTDTGLGYAIIAYCHTPQLHFRFLYYFNFRFKVIYRLAIKATIRQPIPVTS